MFFFGLFSTHLPYILVGFIYFASFAFASMQAMQADALEEPPEEKSGEILIQPQSSSLPDIFFYDDPAGSFAEANEQGIHQAPLIEREIKFRVCSKPFTTTFFNGALFVRPPPVLA